MRDVELSSENVEPPHWLPNLARITARVFDEVGRDTWEIAVMVCDDALITQLNETYRKGDGPTDVLTFSRDDSEAQVAGDVAISLPTVRRNASEFGVDVREEFLRVYVHALLHLAGYTHDGVDLPSSSAVNHPMLGLQERLVTSLQKELPA